MRFRVLGPLEVTDPEGTALDLGSPKLRALLTLLLLDAGRVVPLDRIIDQMWGDEPPASATGTLQSYVSNLRRLLEPDRGPRQPAQVLLTRPPGYTVRVEEDDLDLHCFVRLVADGEAALHAGEPDDAVDLFEQAIALWRGEPAPDLADQPAVEADRMRLVELHLRAREQRAEALFLAGRPTAAVVELDALTTANPLRERPWEYLAMALYAAGRQADALDACRRSARILRDELGIEPGARLRNIEAAVLRQDLVVPEPAPAERPPAAAAPPPSPTAVKPDQTEPEPRTALVGRRSERARLRDALASAAAGNGSLVLLEGEAGIGKTRLAEATAERATADGWTVAWSRCADDAGAPALWPWLQVLRAVEGPGATLTGAELTDPDAQRFALFEDLRARLARAAVDTPLLVVLDDVQAADATSVQLLVLLVRHLGDAPILVVGTARTVGEVVPPHVEDGFAALTRQGGVQRLTLGGLGEGDVRQLLVDRLGLGEDAVLARDLHERTDGNPFFVVELAQLLRSEQHPGRAARTDVPRSVRDVLSRRLERLPEETVALLGLAALVGREVELQTLEQASGLGAERLITLLEPAVISGVVTEDTDRWAWRFSHALVQETLIAGLSRLEQARLHAQVAAALETRTPIDVDGLAHHWFQAVPVAGPEPAFRYAVLAAEEARQRLAHGEAAALTRRALGLLDKEDAEQRHTLLVALGNDMLRSGDPQGAQEIIGQAIEVARTLGDSTLLAEAASVWGGVTLWNWRPYGVVDSDLVALLEELAAAASARDPQLRARLLGTLGVELAYSTRRDEGVAYAEQAVSLARELDDPSLLGRTLNNYGLVAWGASDWVDRRIAAADETLTLVGHGLPARTEFFALLHRAPLKLNLGDVAGFETDLETATRLGAGLTGSDVRPHLAYQECGRAMLYGRWDEAKELSALAYDLFLRTSVWGAQMCRDLHHYTFALQDGDQALADVLDELVDFGDSDIALIQTIAVIAALRIGDHSEAARLQRRWRIGTPTDWTGDALSVARAELSLLLEEDVADHYAGLLPFRGRQIVVGTATACWGSYDELLGRLAQRLDRPEDAHRHFTEALVIGETIGAVPQIDAARRALAL